MGGTSGADGEKCYSMIFYSLAGIAIMCAPLLLPFVIAYNVDRKSRRKIADGKNEVWKSVVVALLTSVVPLAIFLGAVVLMRGFLLANKEAVVSFSRKSNLVIYLILCVLILGNVVVFRLSRKYLFRRD